MKDDVVRPGRGGDEPIEPAEMTEPRRALRRYRIALDGLIAVHAVRAARTALGGVRHVVAADVSMRGAVVDTDGELDPGELARVLEVAGLGVRSIEEEMRRILPLAP